MKNAVMWLVLGSYFMLITFTVPNSSVGLLLAALGGIVCDVICLWWAGKVIRRWWQEGVK